MSHDLTVQELQEAVPKKSKNTITQQLVDDINSMVCDEQFREDYRDNLIGFASILNEGRYKITDYLNAVRYVSFRLMGNNKINSYTKTFPERYAKFIADGASAKTIASYSTSYSKGELVNKMLGQSMIPIHIMNQDILQAAINKQYAIMNNPDASYKVQSDAATSLMVNLRPPETKDVKLEIKVEQHSYIDDLRESANAFANKQIEKIVEGVVTAEEVAQADLLISDDTDEDEID